ncbi:hypothetical protein C1893_14465 [Pseudomonas sp. MPR-ANC1]|uniref:hypothetical protein n=1 Tax=Pseudomonas sp. MPR-ANC1 TaxID=2075548 RepID=UPI000CD1B5F5|nr:hypothetical protein [Pseudomonas sp. MPR-ANC1]POA47649.1 hypothetical protein C1893_14465 [Pseudomonas sp. MPR-ANC1]
MMKLKMTTGVLLSLAMMSTAYAATCPTLSVTHSQDAEDLTFTSARLKDKGTPNSVVICRYEGKDDLGASAGYRNGTPVTGTGSNWKGDDCATTDGDASKCAFK